MALSIRFKCPHCDSWTTTGDVSAPAWACSACNGQVSATGSAPDDALASCRKCGNAELYVRKDFPHWLGMGIIALACLASVVTLAFYWIVATWAILIGSAVLDVILYFAMGNVTVCYRCETEHRGFHQRAEQPFDLAVAERYRQERLRKEELRRTAERAQSVPRGERT